MDVILNEEEIPFLRRTHGFIYMLSTPLGSAEHANQDLINQAYGIYRDVAGSIVKGMEVLVT